MSPPAAHAAVFLLPGFQELEFWYPVLRFREEKVPVSVIGADPERTVFSRLGYPVVADATLDQMPQDATVVVVPGSDPVEPPFRMRMLEALKSARSRGAFVAGSGSGVRLLAEAGLLRGAQVAAPGDLAGLLHDHGASVSGRAVSIDRGVVTARGVDDLPQFFQALLQAIQ